MEDDVARLSLRLMLARLAFRFQNKGQCLACASINQASGLELGFLLAVHGSWVVARSFVGANSV